MAGHPASVVHHSRDVAGNGEMIGAINANAPIFNGNKYPICCNSGYNDIKRGGLLSIGFQLTDLKENHEVILGVTGSCRGTRHSAELCGWH